MRSLVTNLIRAYHGQTSSVYNNHSHQLLLNHSSASRFSNHFEKGTNSLLHILALTIYGQQCASFNLPKKF